jgi:RHS repeat-associated protein
MVACKRTRERRWTHERVAGGHFSLHRDRRHGDQPHRNADGSGGSLEERRYYCQNWRHDVSAVVTDVGKMIEWSKSTSYGIPDGLPAGDTDSDGDWDATDSAAAIGGGYVLLEDAELDGDVDASDITHAKSITGGYQTLGFNVLSSTGVKNRKGYAGYERDHAAGVLYHVRHRVLNTTLGRWTRRDPLGYVDGMNLYDAMSGRPTASVDPFGTCAGSICTSTEHSCVLTGFAAGIVGGPPILQCWVYFFHFFGLLVEKECRSLRPPGGALPCGTGCFCTNDLVSVVTSAPITLLRFVYVPPGCRINYTLTFVIITTFRDGHCVPSRSRTPSPHEWDWEPRNVEPPHRPSRWTSI